MNSECCNISTSSCAAEDLPAAALPGRGDHPAFLSAAKALRELTKSEEEGPACGAKAGTCAGPGETSRTVRIASRLKAVSSMEMFFRHLHRMYCLVGGCPREFLSPLAAQQCVF